MMDDFLKSVEKKAFRIIQIATGNSDDALDILQDSMMAFVRHYSNKSEPELKPLFYRVVRNKIRDWYRKQKLKNLIFRYLPGTAKPESEIIQHPIESVEDMKNPDALTELKNSQAIKKLDESLKKLPHKQQQAFLLRAWEGLSTKETALAMKCSEGTVKTHYFRAVGRLKQELEGTWP